MIAKFENGLSEEFLSASEDKGTRITTLTLFPVEGYVEDAAELDIANRVVDAMDATLRLRCKFWGAVKLNPETFPEIVFSTNDEKSSDQLWGFLSACTALIPNNGFSLQQTKKVPNVENEVDRTQPSHSKGWLENLFPSLARS
ncbi:MAG: hypothetical protein PHX61_10985 [Alphaproteobacteria bacterium]|nr:hypothetical protein [Alphaproteobacteria bacterium]